ncbi:hypothetical protein CEXT_620361 [Caerostris extrusa]|uniref:Uncharacterized protein n=1 Tax=Caerostris extrusa TaxID=172846 RepID=A0AAV4XBX2_CAEEX|nr:hypothetical protein CEXT_620361 [Caerostris extrusa]
MFTKLKNSLSFLKVDDANNSSQFHDVVNTKCRTFNYRMPPFIISKPKQIIVGLPKLYAISLSAFLIEPIPKNVITHTAHRINPAAQFLVLEAITGKGFYCIHHQKQS